MKKIARAVYQRKIRNLHLLECIPSTKRIEIIVEDNVIVPIIRISSEIMEEILKYESAQTNQMNIDIYGTTLRISSEAYADIFDFWFELDSLMNDFKRSKRSGLLRIAESKDLVIYAMKEDCGVVSVHITGNHFWGCFRISKKIRLKIIFDKPPFCINDDMDFPYHPDELSICVNSNGGFTVTFDERGKARVEMYIPLLYVQNALLAM